MGIGLRVRQEAHRRPYGSVSFRLVPDQYQTTSAAWLVLVSISLGWESDWLPLESRRLGGLSAPAYGNQRQ